MRERPEAAGLLATAREVVLKDLLPHLPAREAFAARMVANAMAIAAREAGQDPGWIAEARTRMAALTGNAETPAACLAGMIRAGRLDPGSAGHEEAAAILRLVTRARCSVSAPRALR